MKGIAMHASFVGIPVALLLAASPVFAGDLAVEQVNLRYFDNQTKKYVELVEWSVGGGPAPGSFDIAVKVTNVGSQEAKNVIVHLALAYKLAVLTIDPKHEMTDYETLEKTESQDFFPSQWAQQESISVLSPGKFHTVIFKGFQFKEFYEQFSHKDLWSTELKFIAWVEPLAREGNVSNNILEKSLKTPPGD